MGTKSFASLFFRLCVHSVVFFFFVSYQRALKAEIVLSRMPRFSIQGSFCPFFFCVLVHCVCVFFLLLLLLFFLLHLTHFFLHTKYPKVPSLFSKRTSVFLFGKWGSCDNTYTQAMARIYHTFTYIMYIYFFSFSSSTFWAYVRFLFTYFKQDDFLHNFYRV